MPCSCVLCCNPALIQDIEMHAYAISSRLTALIKALEANPLDMVHPEMHVLNELRRREETLGPNFKTQADMLSALACTVAGLHEENL